MLLNQHNTLAPRSRFNTTRFAAPWKSNLSHPQALSPMLDDEPVWDDWRLVEVAHSEMDEREAVLNHLLHMLLSSIGSYQEIAQLTTDPTLQSFADVVIRQRSAQYQDLLLQSQQLQVDAEEDHESLAALRATWRLAIWNFEQEEFLAFIEMVEQAEALLEEAFLTAANVFHDEDWEKLMQGHAVTVSGVRSVWDEIVVTHLRHQ